MSISTKKKLSSDEVCDFVHNNKDFLSPIDNKNIPLGALTIELPEYSIMPGVKLAKAVKASAARRHAYKTRGGPSKIAAHEKD